MQVKIDTKEKFHVITPIEAELSATMTDELDATLRNYLKNDVKNVILNLQEIQQLDEDIAKRLLLTQQLFYTNNASFVLTNIQKNIMAFLSDKNLDTLLNITLTESEAWDIVQMEEIERELLSEEGIESAEEEDDFA